MKKSIVGLAVGALIGLSLGMRALGGPVISMPGPTDMEASQQGRALWLLPSADPAVPMLTTVFRPAGDGPFPMVVMNHGTTRSPTERLFFPLLEFNAAAVAEAHDEAWRTAYQGIIPGAELRRLINRRGPAWWESAIRKGSRVALLQFGDKVAGYANYGRNRARSLTYDGEIYELYLRPEFQGLGFGRRLFTATRRDLAQSGLRSLVIWALSDNDPAVEFYRALGGRAVARSSERFGDKTLDKVAFAWQP